MWVAGSPWKVTGVGASTTATAETTPAETTPAETRTGVRPCPNRHFRRDAPIVNEADQPTREGRPPLVARVAAAERPAYRPGGVVRTPRHGPQRGDETIATWLERNVWPAGAAGFAGTEAHGASVRSSSSTPRRVRKLVMPSSWWSSSWAARSAITAETGTNGTAMSLYTSLLVDCMSSSHPAGRARHSSFASRAAIRMDTFSA